MHLKKLIVFRKSKKGGGANKNDDGTVTDSPSQAPAQEITMRMAANEQDDDDGYDDLSTLAEPVPMAGVMASDDGLSAYNRAPSFTTAGDNSISSAGFTLGAETTGTSSAGYTFGADTIGTSTYLSFANGNRSVFSDDSFLGPSYMNLREEVLIVRAPPGKLGISLDTPENGAPFIHSIKDVSPLAGALRVGDRIIEVDDEDVRLLTAVKISKILSRKSGQTRKLKIARTIDDT